MKSKIFAAAIAAILVLNTISFANNAPAPVVTASVSILSEAKSIIVNFKDVANEEVTVTILDGSANVLHTETIEDVKAASKKFNFSKVENGTYSLVITQKAVRTTQTFEVTENEIVLSEAGRQIKYLPLLKQKEDKLDIFIPMVNSSVKVAILTNEGVKMFEKASEKAESYAQRFDLSKLNSGIYVVEVQTEAETMYYTIRK